MRISDWSSDVCSSDLGHHLDRCDMELGARLVVLARLLAAEVVAHLHCRKAGIRHQSVFDDVTQIDMAPATCPPGFRLPALVRFDDDALVEDPRRADHQQAQVADDVVDQFGIADVVALDVEPEVVPAQATTVRSEEHTYELQ